MKMTSRAFIVMILVVLLTGLACQASSLGAKTATSEPANTSGTASTQAPAPAGAASQLTLSTPATGLDGLQAYRQSFHNTVQGTFQGQPYDYSETVERLVSGADETDQIDVTTNGVAISLFSARMDNILYSQQKAAQICQAASAGEKTAGTNLALKLPPVRNAAFSQNDSLNGAPAALYIFDQNSVPNQASENGTASGKIWLDSSSGMVLKYELSVQLQDGDFIGTKTWSYTLQPGEVRLALPEGCQPVLADFPALPGAQDILSQPGFTTYTVQAAIAEARKFYLSALPGAGWEPLPTTSAEPQDSESYNPTILTFTQANNDGSGRVLVVQIIDQSGTLTVVAQTFHTQTAVQNSAFTGSQPASAPGEEQTAAGETPGELELPQEIQVYPDATVLMQNSTMLALTTPDSAEKVFDFYSAALDANGWEKSMENSANGIKVQMWKKYETQVSISCTTQDGITTVTLVAAAE